MKYTHNKKYVKAFGAHLKKVRLSKNITQADLAANCGVEISQISRIERGVFSTSISNVYIIAQALEIHPRKLFDFDFED